MLRPRCPQLSLGGAGETENKKIPVLEKLRLTWWVFSHGLP